MCLICVEFGKKKMTKEELKAGLKELSLTTNNNSERLHYNELLSSINSNEEMVYNDQAKKLEIKK